MGTGIIITMCSVGVFTAVSEKILNALGKGDIAEWVKVGGISLNIGLGLTLIKSALSSAKGLL